MMSIPQIAAILGLLLAFGVDPATVARVDGILSAQPAPQAIQAPLQQALPPQEAPTSAGVPQDAPHGRIEVVSEGYRLNHLDAPHCVASASIPSWDAATQDCQFVQLGVFVYDAAGNPIKNADLMASTTDQAQNRVIHGTGTSDGHYGYGFLLRAPSNVVQFIYGDAQTSVTINAQ